MLSTIKFDYQSLFYADEIDDVGRNRMLPPKLETSKIAVFQLKPQSRFRVG